MNTVTPAWIISALYLITLVNVLVSAGYAIAGVVQARTAPNGVPAATSSSSRSMRRRTLRLGPSSPSSR